ncbi:MULTISPECIES: aspartate kinase [Leeuwenhoekiella]|jgi:aspartate kinase|uniref:Aspartokinase n=1 Tax=Leeuwenhoekiella blandensis (strain CECT 7118 / CCUG 51940 / KCTC 22103 / MED217) TaxID=398720 RepID=A3XH83_LEEBM|nr:MULTISPECIES: aspartate kinase [Leeuwenhoekiella]EAQ51361.1 aspartokinase [Leeuwenhoekiella blandensis MED217]MAO43544.1 aspartate kinase [Leeuwenhoekiella sp.]MBQ52152.1 aspartate kinase [Leeuwenhoekiella sp.]HCW64324.1 aspartate kinase [Leeuwenhoekiella sp.]|tara:strand:+ start:484 stop:1809 length:1326 start_codon:yes stop_codon:yes gene_type:complete
MNVLKFGGTSVGSAQNIRKVVEILSVTEKPKIVVLSAMSGVTNLLVSLNQASIDKDLAQITNVLEQLQAKHFEAIEDLFTAENQPETKAQIETFVAALQEIATGGRTLTTYAELVTYGETMLTWMFSRFLDQENVSNVLLNASTFMNVGSVENPNIEAVAEALAPQLAENPSDLYITQGFVCRDERGALATLKRGGSDFSATIIAAAVDAAGVQIWTDIDGLHNNDPRYVQETQPIEHLTYNEAAELAYFGAKILHPQTVAPVIDRDIPVWLKNTFEPSAAGTKISNEYHNRGLKAISAKDGITAIKIKSNRMLGAHGFLRTIFEVFDRHETSIDMITTSEVAISLTIDDTRNLKAIITELSVIAEVTVEEDHSIICIVGENLIADHESYKAFGILNSIPVRMIAYGGSNNNISLLVPTREKINTLQYLNAQLFQLEGAIA